MHYYAYIMRGKKEVASFVAAFQALSEPTRLRIMTLLCRAGRELCVCEFVDALEAPQYHISRCLKILLNAGLVSERREGKWVHYKLPSGLDAFGELTLKAIKAMPKSVLTNDLRELKRRLKLRENGKCLLGVQKTYLLSRRK
jgi:ArsR family transcriptional regulator, arsenate/arsenite/antimonite-responsive transcriptional repressor